MLTLPNLAPLERDGRAPYRPYRAYVRSITELSPGFRRVTFTGPDLEFFAPHRLDQRIKLMFPLPGAGAADLGVDDESALRDGTWFSLWRRLPERRRSPIRTFTVRGVRPHRREVDVDFAWHGEAGPAARWLSRAAVGDEIAIVGPDARSLSSTVGIGWHPGTARQLLLVGDDTAAPAICSILECLPPGIRARAFVLVPSDADRLEIVSNAEVEITWLTGGVVGAVRSWSRRAVPPLAASPTPADGDLSDDRRNRGEADMPWSAPDDAEGELYAWIAGESSMVKELRRLLVNEAGLDRSRVAFMGYWKRGAAESVS